jgi:hypothetical protein
MSDFNDDDLSLIIGENDVTSLVQKQTSRANDAISSPKPISNIKEHIKFNKSILRYL